MSRRGQCRCGLILTFHRTAQGYKMRCPSCGAVVRLRAPKKGRKPPGDGAAPVPAPPGGAPPATELPPGAFDVELVPADAGPVAAAQPQRHKWLALAVLTGVVLLGVVGGAVWWFVR
jgi:hypothetical protein